ncbi:MAG: hypothetical protein JXQ96_18740 [Cyclobacteriaceae bacterium]
MRKHLFPFLFVGIVVWSCAEDAEVFFNDPVVQVRFINADSVAFLTDSLSTTNDSIEVISDTINWYSDSINVLTDSLSILNDSIDNGRTDYVDIRDALQSTSNSFADNLDSANKISDELSQIRSSINAVINTINSGEVLVSSISNPITGVGVAITDSAPSYNLPLSMTTNSSVTVVEIAGQLYTIEWKYDTEEFVDNKRRIRVGISNLEIVNSDFDSTSCNSSNCENEASIKFYF